MNLISYSYLKNWPESDAGCIKGLFLWREDSSVINSESYRVYYKEDKQANQIASGFTILLLDHFLFRLIDNSNQLILFCLQHMTSQAQTSTSLIWLSHTTQHTRVLLNCHCRYLHFHFHQSCFEFHGYWIW